MVLHTVIIMITLFALKSALSDIYIATSDSFGLVLARIIILYPFF